MSGSLSHLARRFFDVLGAEGLSDSEIGAVRQLLSPSQFHLFAAQQPADQRHGYHAGLSVIASGIEDADVVTAALMHDVGKRHAGFGVVMRSVVSVLILARLPLTARMRQYRDHGAIAAAEIEEANGPGLAVLYAYHHHQGRPADIDTATWDVLQAADQPPKARLNLPVRIFSTRP